MRIDQNYLIRASTIDELLSDDFTEDKEPTALSESEVEDALRRWCRFCASNDWNRFEERLQKNGWTSGRVKKRLKFATATSKSYAPQWLRDSKWILSALRISSPQLRKTNKLPFGEIYSNLAIEVERRLYFKARLDQPTIISQQAKTELLIQYCVVMSSLIENALYDEFLQFKARCCRRVEYNDSTCDRRGQYRAFIDYLRNEGLSSIFSRMPVLLRLLAVRTRQWIDSTSEILTRFNCDREVVHTFLSSTSPDFTVSKITLGISDLHNDGRSVALFSFSNSRKKLLLKPRPPTSDIFWARFVSYLNATRKIKKLVVPRLIPRQDYFWAEFIAHRVCRSKNELRLYYEKAGSLVCLLQLTCGTDFHYENLVASNSNPVIVDMETIFQPQISYKRERLASADDRALEMFMRSPFSSGLLPTYNGLGESMLDTGGLTTTSYMSIERHWESLCTNEIRYFERKTKVQVTRNLPFKFASDDLFFQYLDNVIEGYQRTWDVLINLRDKLGVSWLYQLSNQVRARVILKPTQFYSALIERLLDHRKMITGVVWSAESDFVSRFSFEYQDQASSDIPRAERYSLCNLNVPYFFYIDGFQKLKTHVNDISVDVLESGIEKSLKFYEKITRENISTFSKSLKICLIQGDSHAQNSQSSSVKSSSGSSGNSIRCTESIDRSSNLTEVASQVKDILLSNAINENESVSWMGIQWIGGGQYPQLSPLGYDLYSGKAGIALFLAAYGESYKCSAATEYASRCFVGIMSDLKGSRPGSFVKKYGFGGGTGLGSIIYALSTVGLITQNRRLFDFAECVVDSISTELLEQEKEIDALGGLSGFLLGLVKYCSVAQSQSARVLAVSAGNVLLNKIRQFVDSDDVGLSSLHPERRLLTGMSHGAAGIALAFSRLAKLDNSEKFSGAADRLIEYENKFFSVRENNWADLRKGVPRQRIYKTCQWCNGSIGIGLSRIGIAKLRRNKLDLFVDVKRALESVTSSTPSTLTTLCCGRLGAIEFQLEAGRLLKTDNDNQDREALSSFADLIYEGTSGGSLALAGSGSNYNFGLYRGVSGIGYTALRLRSRSLPNILLWE